MKRTRLVKQALAVLLSLSMSFCPAAPPLAAFAAGEGAAFGTEAAEEIVTEAEESATEADTITAAAETDAGEEMESATASDAEKEDKSSSTASSSDALYDEDGFLLDGTVSDDRPEEEKTGEVLPEEEEEAAAADADWRVLQAETEELLVTVRAEKDVLPETASLEAELEEQSGITLVKIRFLDGNGDELEPDREKGRLYVTFSGMERPEDGDGNALPDDALTVWGLKYAGDEEGKELEKVDETEDLLLSGALLSAEGGIENDLGEEADENGEAAGGEADTVTVTVKPEEYAVFALAWSLAGAKLLADGSGYNVTFDYGIKLFWEAGVLDNGEPFYGAFSSDENGYWASSNLTLEEAEAQASQTVTFHVDEGMNLGAYPFSSEYAMALIDGRPATMNGWVDENGNYLETDDFPGYIPSSDVTFHMVWDTDYNIVTFDYGMLPVWEEDGKWFYIRKSGIYEASDRESAEAKAEQVLTYYLRNGNGFHEIVPYPPVPVEFDGKRQMITGWQNDTFGTYRPDDPTGFYPDSDTEFRANWADDLISVTFDYGEKPVWEADGRYYSICREDYGTYPHSFDTREEAEAAGIKKTSFYLSPGESLLRYISYPNVPVSIGGQEQFFDCWESDTGEVFSTDDVYNYIPQGDVTFSAQWISDFVTVTADYGMNLIWEKDGEWHWLESIGQGVSEVWSPDKESAEERALDHVTYYVKPGKEMKRSFWTQPSPMTIDGEERMMIVWKSDEGETLGLGMEYDYVPTQDVTFHMQWSTDICAVTFDLGEKLVWEQYGYYYSIYYASPSDAAYVNGYSSCEEAAENAADVVILHTSAGEALQRSIGLPDETVFVNGQPRKLKGWKSDTGEFVEAGREYSYVPEGDVVFRPQWSTDFYTVTFDYGDGIIWEEDGGFKAVVARGMNSWIESFGTKEEAAGMAARTVSFPVVPGESLSNGVACPDSAVLIDGTMRLMTGWENENGEQLTSSNTWSYVPAGNVTFFPKWEEELYKITVDYGSRLVWENTTGQEYYYFINRDGYVSSAPDYEYAEQEAHQTVSFYVQKGSSLNRSVGQPYGVVLVAGRPVYFNGWKNAEGKILSTYELEQYVPEGDVAFEASWTECCIITLHENNGAGEDEQIYRIYNAAKGKTISIGTGSGDLYGFHNGEDRLIYGWSTERDTPVSELKPSVFTPTEDLDLYAIWGRGCVVTLDTAGGELGNWQETRHVIYPGSRFYIDEFSPIKEGYRFEGWIDPETGEIVHLDHIVPQKDVTLTAKYSGSIPVTFVENFEGSTDKRIIELTENWENKLRRYFERDGYALLGYSREKNASEPEYVIGSWLVPEEGMKLYGIWKKMWDLTIDLNGGECQSPYEGWRNIFKRNVFDGLDVLEDLNTWYRGRMDDSCIFYCDGKVFGGWCYDPEGTQDVQEGHLMSGDLTVYAKWVDGWHVTVDYGDYGIYPEDEEWGQYGGLYDFYVKKGESLKQPRIRYETEEFAVLTGYRVDGQVIPTLEGFTPTKDVNIQAVITTENLAVLRFHQPKGISMWTSTYWWGETEEGGLYYLVTEKGTALNTALMELPRYESINDDTLISGWSLKKDGTEPVDFSTKIFTEDTDLYPILEDAVSVGLVLSQRTDRKVSISFPDHTWHTRNGKDGDCVQVLYKKGNVITYPEDSTLKCGNLVFQGWYMNKDYSGDPIFIPSSAFKAEKDMTLYAKWGERVAVSGITLDPKTLELKTGEKKTLTASVQPEDATNRNIVWSSSNTAVAAVDENGEVTAVKAGTADITVTTEEGGFEAVCTITVIQPVEGVGLDKTENSVETGKCFTLTADVKPGDATNKNVTWTSSNKAVATVDTNGKVSGVKAGTADITVTTVDGGFTAVCHVTVIQRVTGVTISKTTNEVTVGESFTLTAAVAPADATNKKVTWSSSDTSVATVDQSGKVTAKKAGTASITVKTEDGGKTAACRLTVKAKEDPVESFVKHLYKTCLSREADAGGLAYWTGLIKNGSKKGIRLAGDFVFSKEFTEKNYCNEHFVKQLYTALMGRDPEKDPSGVNYWIGVLENGTTREALLNSFTSSAEYKKLCTDAGFELGGKISDTTFGGKKGIGTKPYGPCAVCGHKTKVVQFAERMYTVCLGRAAESTGLAYWSKGLYEKTITGKSILENFFLSKEIKGKNLNNREYVQRIYKVMLDRNPDAGGLNYWSGKLDSGASPTAVIDGFIDSKEFTQICDDYGIKRK